MIAAMFMMTKVASAYVLSLQRGDKSSISDAKVLHGEDADSSTLMQCHQET